MSNFQRLVRRHVTREPSSLGQGVNRIIGTSRVASLAVLGFIIALAFAMIPDAFPASLAQPMPHTPAPPDRDDPPRFRDGNIAVREEFDAAIRAGKAEALELFIARHSGHPLAVEARARLAALRTR